MAATVGSVTIDLQAQLAKFESDMGRAARIAEKEMEKMRRQIDGRLKAIDQRMAAFANKAGNILRGMFAGVSAGALIAFEKRLINIADNVNDMSKKFGIATQTLSIWRIAAEKSGTSLDGIARGAKQLTKDLDGSETKLKSMGIALRDSAGQVKPMDKLMGEIAKKVSTYSDGAEKAALMTALFGKSGTDLIPFMEELGKNLERNEQRARAFGAIIGPDLAKASDEFNDNQRDMQVAVEGFGLSILRTVLPALNAYTGAQLDAAEKSGALVKAGETVGTWLKGIALGFVFAKNTVDVLIDSLVFLKEAFMNVAGLAGKQLDAMENFARNAMDIMSRDLLSNPLERISQMASAQEDLFHALGANAEEATNGIVRNANDFGEAFNKNIQDVSDAMDTALTPSIDNAADANKKLGDSAGVTAPKLLTEADAAAAAAEKLRLFTEAMAEWEKAQKAYDREQMKNEAAMIRSERALEDLTNEYRDHMIALRQDIDLAGRDANGRRLLTNEIEANAEATRIYLAFLDAGINVNEAWRQALAEQIRLHKDQRDAIAAATAAAEDFARAWQSGSDAAFDAFGDFLTGGIDSFEDFGDTLEDIAGNFLSNLVKMFRQTVLTPGGGGWDAFTNNLNRNSMFGPGGQGSSVGGWMSAGASAYGGWAAAQQGNTLGSVAGFASSGAQIGGTTGAIVGAVVGALVSLFKRSKPDDIRLGGSSANVRSVEGSFSTDLGTIQAGSRGIKYEDFIQSIQQFDTAIVDMLQTVEGGEPQLVRIRAALATWVVDLKGSAATAENILGSRFGAILGTFDADIQTFVNGAEKLEDKVTRLGAAFAAQSTFADLDLDVTFGQFLGLVTQFGGVGEDVTATMDRIVGSTVVLNDALAFMGVELDLAGVAFVTFATDITEAAGGIEAAASLWNSFFEGFYTESEQAAARVTATQATLFKEAADIGLSPTTTRAQFRELFEAALPTLKPEQVVEWLQFGQAIVAADEAAADYAETLGTVTTASDGARASLRAGFAEIAEGAAEINAIIGDAAWDNYLAGLSEYDAGLARINRQYDEGRERLIRLGASTAQLAAYEDQRAISLQNYADGIEAVGEAVEAALTSISAGQLVIEQWSRLQEIMEEVARVMGSSGGIIAQLEAVKIKWGDLFNEARTLNASEGQLTLIRTAATVEARSLAEAELARLQSMISAGDEYQRWLDAELLSGTSTLTPLQQLEEARRQFDAAIASGADAGTITGLADTLSQMNQEFNASGDAYEELRSYIRDNITALAQGQTVDQALLDAIQQMNVLLASIAAGTFFNFPSYDTGTPYVPYDQTARIHKGEMVVDAATSASLRNYGVRSEGGDSRSSTDMRDFYQRQDARENRQIALLERNTSALERLATSGSRNR